MPLSYFSELLFFVTEESMLNYMFICSRLHYLMMIFAGLSACVCIQRLLFNTLQNPLFLLPQLMDLSIRFSLSPVNYLMRVTSDQMVSPSVSIQASLFKVLHIDQGVLSCSIAFETDRLCCVKTMRVVVIAMKKVTRLICTL